MMGWMAPLRHLSAKLLSDLNSSEFRHDAFEPHLAGMAKDGVARMLDSVKSLISQP
jgi:hypothetical protein